MSCSIKGVSRSTKINQQRATFRLLLLFHTMYIFFLVVSPMEHKIFLWQSIATERHLYDCVWPKPANDQQMKELRKKENKRIQSWFDETQESSEVSSHLRHAVSSPVSTLPSAFVGRARKGGILSYHFFFLIILFCLSGDCGPFPFNQKRSKRGKMLQKFSWKVSGHSEKS